MFNLPSRHASSRRILFAAAATALASILSSAAAYADPFLSGTAGTGTNTFYFTMDFRDFVAPQSYAFGLKSNASTLTFEQILQGLTGIPTFTTRINQSAQFGASLDGLGFAGKQKYNDFAGNNSGEPNGFWSQWNGSDGLSWVEDSVGISGQSITAGHYAGASWTANYLTVSDAPPRTPQVAAAAAPEPGTLFLLTLCGPAAFLLLRRRRSKPQN